MNKREAEVKGYQFTGDYSRNKEEIKEKAQNLKSLGIKSVITPIKADPCSRGQKTGIVGYSLYAEPKLALIESLKDYENRVASQAARMESLLKNQFRILNELKEMFTEELQKKAQLEESLVNYSF